MDENTVIVFKNGSYIKTLHSSECVRGRRAKLAPHCDIDDWMIPEDVLEVIDQFCVKKDSEEDACVIK